MPYQRVKLVVTTNPSVLCQLPYYNHSNGCPNYNKKKGCPPRAKPIGHIMDLKKPVYVIWNYFSYGAHRRRMRKKHPDWSPHQVRCCLWWQPKARKQLEEEIKKFSSEVLSKFLILRVPEAHGVNITATMKKVGIELEWPPKTKTYQVALAGVLR